MYQFISCSPALDCQFGEMLPIASNAIAVISSLAEAIIIAIGLDSMDFSPNCFEYSIKLVDEYSITKSNFPDCKFSFTTHSCLIPRPTGFRAREATMALKYYSLAPSCSNSSADFIEVYLLVACYCEIMGRCSRLIRLDQRAFRLDSIRNSGLRR